MKTNTTKPDGTGYDQPRQFDGANRGKTRWMRLLVLSGAIWLAANPAWEARAGDLAPAVVSAVKSELAKETAADKFSGAVLIARNGETLFEAAYGYADREHKIPNTVETKFRFGSMGKMFTAVAVMQLVQAGKVKLDDPIAKYLPDYPNKGVAEVTVYQLLTHTGGTGDIFSPEFETHRLELKTLKDYVSLYGNRGVAFAPGSDWDYSNYGFILLGRIIEVASGQSYYDYLRDHVFTPTGMNATGNQPEDSQVPDLSIGYAGPGGPGLHLIGPGPGPSPEGQHDAGGTGLHLLPTPNPGAGAPPSLRLLPDTGSKEGDGGQPTSGADSLRPTTGSLPYRGTSAGGGYSTVGDFLKFADAIISHKLLNAQASDRLTTGKVATRMPGVKYAFGFEDDSRGGGRCIGHGGGSPGMNGRLMIFPDSKYVIVVLANFDPPAADDMARFIRDQLTLK